MLRLVLLFIFIFLGRESFLIMLDLRLCMSSLHSTPECNLLMMVAHLEKNLSCILDIHLSLRIDSQLIFLYTMKQYLLLLKLAA